MSAIMVFFISFLSWHPNDKCAQANQTPPRKDIEAVTREIEARIRENREVMRKMLPFMEEMTEWLMRINPDPSRQQKLKELREKVAKKKREFAELERQWDLELGRHTDRESLPQRIPLQDELRTGRVSNLAPPPREVKR